MGYPKELELRVLTDSQFRCDTALGRKIAASEGYNEWRKELFETPKEEAGR